MTVDSDPAEHDAPPSTAVTVTVVRSGGFAGISRRWGVHAPPSDPQRWLTLVAECPWDDAPRHDSPRDSPPTSGADRFAWTIEVSRAGADHRAALTEAEATGAWRALIDAVRAASDAHP